MNIIIERENQVCKVYLDGRLDTQTYMLLEERVNDILTDDITSLIFDFTKLHYISSAGLRVVLLFVKQTKKMNIKFEIVNMPNEIINVFKLTGFIDIVTIN